MKNNVNVNANAPGEYDAIGLLYGGFVLIGMAAGAFAGFMVGGGHAGFLSGGWIDSVIGLAAGLFVGVGVGLIFHGVFVSKRGGSQ